MNLRITRYHRDFINSLELDQMVTVTDSVAERIIGYFFGCYSGFKYGSCADQIDFFIITNIIGYCDPEIIFRMVVISSFSLLFLFLSLSGCKQLTDDSIRYLTGLHSLSLLGCCNVTDDYNNYLWKY